MNPGEKVDITFIQTEDLIDELVKRHDAIAIHGVRFTNVNGEFHTIRRWSGHRFTVLALISTLAHAVNTEIVNITHTQPGQNKDR